MYIKGLDELHFKGHRAYFQAVAPESQMSCVFYVASLNTKQKNTGDPENRVETEPNNYE